MADTKDLHIAIENYVRRNALTAFRPKALLCDMDGTLYDSMPRHAEAWRQMTSEIGLDIPIENFFAYEGRTGAATIDIIFNDVYGHGATDEDKKRLYARKTELFKTFQDTHGIAVMPDARIVVEMAMHCGMTTVLVTGSGQGSLIQRLDCDYPGAFPADRRVTSHSVTHGKPHPEPYLRAVEIAGCNPTEAIALENAPLGVESAARAGVFTIAVATGPIPVQQLHDAGADIVFESMTECAEAFCKYFNCDRI